MCTICLPDESCGSSFSSVFWSRNASKLLMYVGLVSIFEMMIHNLIKRLITSALFGWQKSYLIDQDWMLEGRNNPGQYRLIPEHFGAQAVYSCTIYSQSMTFLISFSTMRNESCTI